MSAGVPYLKPLPAWTPYLLSSLRAWYDAADAATIVESGGLVSQWNDKSGAARHVTQGTGSAQPTTGVRTLNGLNVLDFDGADYLRNASFPIDSLSVSVFVVAVLDAIDNASDAVFAFNSAKDFGLVANNASQFDGSIVCVGASNPPSTPLSGGPFPGPSIYNASVNTSGLRIRGWVDGVMRANVGYVGGITSNQPLLLFSDRTGVYQPDGAIAEVVVVTRTTTDEQQKLEGYLAWKWGIQGNLPSGHPYETHPPFA